MIEYKNGKRLNNLDGTLTRVGYIDILAGQEVWSIDFEGCVLVTQAGSLVMNGKVIIQTADREILSRLFDSYVRQCGF